MLARRARGVKRMRWVVYQAGNSGGAASRRGRAGAGVRRTSRVDPATPSSYPDRQRMYLQRCLRVVLFGNPAARRGRPSPNRRLVESYPDRLQKRGCEAQIMQHLTRVFAISLALCATSCLRIAPEATSAKSIQQSPARSPTPEDVALLSKYLTLNARYLKAGGKSHPAREELRRLRPQVLDILDALLPASRAGQRSDWGPWQAFVHYNILRDGMALHEAVALLGPPTHRIDGRVHWYHNYAGWHVYPDLSARDEAGRLFDFRIGKR